MKILLFLAVIAVAVYLYQRISAKRRDEELERLKRSIGVTKRVSGTHQR